MPEEFHHLDQLLLGVVDTGDSSKMVRCPDTRQVANRPDHQPGRHRAEPSLSAPWVADSRHAPANRGLRAHRRYAPAALVGRNGSIDWLCAPRFDSAACFAALVGEERHGRWLLTPAGAVTRTTRRYREDTLVLETVFETEEGSVRLVDFMPVGAEHPHVVRVVEGLDGSVQMRMELIVRFEYGSVIPWVHRSGDAVVAVGGPDALCLRSDIETQGQDFTTVAEFKVEHGQSLPFVPSWFPSHRPLPKTLDAQRALTETGEWCRSWSSRCTYRGEYREAVVRSLITLKALTYRPTGGIVAAPTTSLPEQLGGIRNWDYRYCWLRDATFTLYALMLEGSKRRRKRGVTGSSGRWPDTPTRCRSCMARPGRDG
jgi:GH15 family glucan-1,4-alpha-glucosidase